jgi:Putative phage tail protein
MATVILTAVGSAIGGQIGGAIGSIVGQQLDRMIFGSGKPREGPRIKELQVQTSSYGTQIPAIFGAMRVAGTVIWSTDLIERKVKSGGGKGRPATVNYSYSASFVVAISSRPVARIGRIWADGNLLRGAAGDFKTQTSFRFRSGHADEPLDPLLASAEQSGRCPAYRGLACAVFQDLQLADFGNRIPSLTFEVFESETPVNVAAMMDDVSKGALAGQSQTMLDGFAVQGSDCRSAFQPVLAALPIIVRPSGASMRVSDWSATSDTIGVVDPAIRDGGALDRPGLSRNARSAAPSSVSIRYYDAVRDFQAGVQTSRQLGVSRNDEQLDLAASISADNARRFADLQSMQRRQSLNGYEAVRVTDATPVSAGAMLEGDAGGQYRIVEIEHLRGSTRISALQWIDTAASATLEADSGRNAAEPDLLAGQTRIMLADLPAMGPDDPGRPAVVVAAAGTAPGWRSAAVSVNDGGRIIEIGATNGVATIGNILAPLSPHSPMVEDMGNQPVVRLVHAGMSLPTGSGDPSAFDAPSLWINGEIIRYGAAEKIGPCDFRLNRLLRDCFGTDHGGIAHPANSELFLIERDSLLAIDSVPTPVGSTVQAEALGLADVTPVGRSLVVAGHAISPRKPVHGQIGLMPGGDLLLSWMRRDRLAQTWSDGADIINSEGVGRMDIELRVGGAIKASWSVAATSLQIPAADLTALGIPPASTLEFSVIEQGRFARSAPLILQFTN